MAAAAAQDSTTTDIDTNCCIAMHFVALPTFFAFASFGNNDVGNSELDNKQEAAAAVLV